MKLRHIVVLAGAVLILVPTVIAQSKAKAVVLALASQAAVAADEYTTLGITQPQRRKEPGGIIVVTPPEQSEGDPLARPFLKLPRPAYYASGAVMSAGMTYWSRDWRRKQGWRRKVWWLPQVVQTGLNGFMAYRNAKGR